MSASAPSDSRGKSKTTLDTPALLVDVEVLDDNIRRIAEACRRNNLRWRPHVKGQKVVEVVRREIAAGAVGITCAKLGEAEVMADAGIDDILIANQIVGATKIARLIELARRARVTVAVDHPDNVAALGQAARSGGVTLPVVIEVDIGMKRAGVLPGESAVALAKRIAATAGLRFDGVMAWEAHAIRIADPDEKRRVVEQAVGALIATANNIRREGIPVGIVSCSGTGTYAIATGIKGVTEIQAGGGVFSDICYRKLFNVDHPYAMTIMSTVVSRPTPRRIICDAGKKSMSGDMALPEPIGLAGIASVRLSAELATIELDRDDAATRVGDPLEFVVGYSDTTVHLHDELYAVRGGIVEAVWPVIARGKTR